MSSPTSTPISRYKWYLLVLAAMTNVVVIAIPSISLSVLLPEISTDLHLSVLQVGWVWGINSLPALFMGLIGGSFGDRLGPKRLLIVSCLLAGLLGGLRGIATSYQTLLVMSLLYGVLTPVINMNNWKVASMWFSSAELGLASGVLSMGMGSGFLIGSAISATLISPWLGGWQYVFFFYGAISIVFAVFWFFTRVTPYTDSKQVAVSESGKGSIIGGISQIAKIKTLWFLGLSVMTVMGANQGLAGYLPLFLQSTGWTEAGASAALGIYNAVSAVFVLPIALWSDRLGSRKKIMIGAVVFIIAGMGMLSFVTGGLIWAAVIIGGFVRDGFMAVLMTSAIETKGVGQKYAGTATGFIMTFIGVGNLLAPPLGNYFARYTPGAPFLFWTGLAIFGILCITQTAGSRASDNQLAMESAFPEGQD